MRAAVAMDNAGCPKMHWKDVASFHFFLFPPSPTSAEWLLKKALNDLEKRFIQFGELTYAKVKGAIVKVSLKIAEGACREKILAEVQDGFFHTLRVDLPLYLLSRRERVLSEMEQIALWNSVQIETDLRKKFCVTISGIDKNIYRSKTELFRIAEKAQGRASHVVDAYICAEKMVVSGARVYFETKVRSKRALVLDPERAEVSAHFTDRKTYRTTLSTDQVKFAYLLTYGREAIEDILVKQESYIEERAKPAHV